MPGDVKAGGVRYIYKADGTPFIRESKKVDKALEKTEKKTKKTRRELSGFEHGLGRLATRIRNLRTLRYGISGAVGLVLGGAGFVTGAKAAGAYAAELIEVSKGLGLSTEASQKWQQALRSDGIEAKKATEIYRKMARAAEDAAAGRSKAAQDALRGFGITDFAEFAALDARGKTQALSRGAERKSLTQTEIVALLGALRVRDAQFAGIVGEPGRIDALYKGIEDLIYVTDRAASALKDLDQLFGDLGTNIKNLGANIFGGLAEPLEDVIGFINSKLQDHATALAAYAENLNESLDDLADVAKILGGMVSAFAVWKIGSAAIEGAKELAKWFARLGPGVGTVAVVALTAATIIAIGKAVDAGREQKLRASIVDEAANMSRFQTRDRYFEELDKLRRLEARRDDPRLDPRAAIGLDFAIEQQENRADQWRKEYFDDFREQVTVPFAEAQAERIEADKQNKRAAAEQLEREKAQAEEFYQGLLKIVREQQQVVEKARAAGDRARQGQFGGQYIFGTRDGRPQIPGMFAAAQQLRFSPDKGASILEFLGLDVPRAGDTFNEQLAEIMAPLHVYSKIESKTLRLEMNKEAEARKKNTLEYLQLHDAIKKAQDGLWGLGQAFVRGKGYADAFGKALSSIWRAIYDRTTDKLFEKLLDASFAGGRAGGGMIPAGSFAMTGEKGVELAYYPRETGIISNSDLAEAMRGRGSGQIVVAPVYNFEGVGSLDEDRLQEWSEYTTAETVRIVRELEGPGRRL